MFLERFAEVLTKNWIPAFAGMTLLLVSESVMPAQAGTQGLHLDLVNPSENCSKQRGLTLFKCPRWSGRWRAEGNGENVAPSFGVRFAIVLLATGTTIEATALEQDQK